MKNTNSAADAGPERLVRIREVLHRVGCGRSTLYRMISGGAFPRPISLGARAVAWPESSVSAFIQAKIESAKHGA